MPQQESTDVPVTNLGSLLVLRAVVAAALSAAITFSANHSSLVGEISFIAFGFVMAPIFMMTAFGGTLSPRSRNGFLAMAVASVVAAAVMAALIGPVNEASPADSLRAFTLVVGIWAALSAASEIFAGWFHANKPQARDMFVLGVMAALLAAVELLIPLNDVYAVGLLGAYGAVVAVYSAIAGFSIGVRRPSKSKGN